MNRLILIGNGFDLAHGMKTSYYDFICSYIGQVCQIAKKDITYENELMYVEKELSYSQVNIDDNTDIKSLFYLQKPLLPNHIAMVNNIYRENVNGLGIRKPFIINFKNNFIEKIFTQCHESKWVDIENEFYEELKKILNDNQQTKAARISSLNISMKFLINELGKYMRSLRIRKTILEYNEIFNQPILNEDIHPYVPGKDKISENTLVLNFNYTKTVEQYNLGDSFTVNYIHGCIDDLDKIIFGFGDEIDEDYKKLENEKTKGFLSYIKSFWYFKTSNYRNLIRFIESNDYQVYIIGHSCGLSDRIMLKMIFEYERCNSIKIFYHGTKEQNNHTELTQEISRHFTDKGVMRTKIVSENKSFPMPQIK